MSGLIASTPCGPARRSPTTARASAGGEHARGRPRPRRRWRGRDRRRRARPRQARCLARHLLAQRAASAGARRAAPPRPRAGWRSACSRRFTEASSSGPWRATARQHLPEDPERVPAPGGDVDAGVAALEARDLHAGALPGRRPARAQRDAARGDGVEPAGAADGELPLLLAVEVEEVLRARASPGEGVRAGEARSPRRP